MERSRIPNGMIASKPIAPWGSATLSMVPEFAVPSAGTTSPGEGNDYVKVATTVPLSPASTAKPSSATSSSSGMRLSTIRCM